MTGDLRPIPKAVVNEASESEEEFNSRMQEAMSDTRYGNDASYTRKIELEFERRHPE